MLLCNSSTLTKNGPNSGSPDELALLHGFKQLGGFILAKDETVVRLRLPRGSEETWAIERMNAFSSERKRMSVVARNVETGEIRLYMKVKIGAISVIQGADDSVLPRCAPSPAVLDSVRRSLSRGTQRGYRTMVFASRGYSEESWKSFAERFASAEIAVKARDQLLASM